MDRPTSDIPLRPDLPDWHPATATARTTPWALARMCLGQAKVIFHGQRSRGQPWAQIAPPAGAHLLRLQTDGREQVAGLFGPALDGRGRAAPDGTDRPSILFFYGHAMCLKETLSIFRLLRRLGVNVLIPEYVGYGMSSGQPAERNCYQTADAAYHHLLSRGDVNPDRIVAMGASLGGAVAIDLAARRRVAGLVTLVTFSSLVDLVRTLLPRWAPVGWLVRHRFESERKIRRVRCPALIAHSGGDELIPRGMADRLAAAAGGPVRRVDVAAAGHNAAEMLRAAGRDLVPELREFLRGI